METVRSTHVIVKWLVWCFILFSRRTSLEYPVWQKRLSCWKGTLASDFFFFFFNFLFIFSLNLKFPKRAAELCIRLDSEISAAPYGPDCLCPEGTAGSAAPFPEGSPCPAQGQGSPRGPSSCPSDAGAGLVFSTPQPCYSSSGQITIKCFECLSDSKKILHCWLLSWSASHPEKQ